MKRRRVLILGGGCAGVSAAWALSSTPQSRRRFDVTLLQSGWRLGGKLASGRNSAASMRNEEHGLHVWFGFYDNAFRMAREVLDAWEKPPGCPIQTLDDMLVPHAYTPVGIAGPQGYRVWDVQFARNRGGLVASTLATSIGINLVAADQYLSIVVPGRMYRPAYIKMGLDPKNLSRCMEDGGTITSPLIPWNSCGAYMFATLGVFPLAYLPFAFLNLINPLISLIYGYTGWTMTPLESNESESSEIENIV